MRIFIVFAFLCSCIYPILAEENLTKGKAPGLAEELTQLLGKTKVDAELVKFCETHGLLEYTKGDSGGFSGSINVVPYSLLYRENIICRVVINVSNPPNYPKGTDWAVFKEPLPLGLDAADTPDDVIKKLGEPAARPEPSYLAYNKPNVVISFYRGTNQLAEIDLDAPRR